MGTVQDALAREGELDVAAMGKLIGEAFTDVWGGWRAPERHDGPIQPVAADVGVRAIEDGVRRMHEKQARTTTQHETKET